ncbi:MAG TPA: hypothetical protein PKN86_18965, partial [Candidatus Obscuribacter sp.]|nr:hypothetical protein [Candidatus Obscuribacter sp.]
MAAPDISRAEDDSERSLRKLRNLAAKLAESLGSRSLVGKVLAHLNLAELGLCPMAIKTKSGTGSTIIKELNRFIGSGHNHIVEDRTTFSELCSPFQISQEEWPGSEAELTQLIIDCAQAVAGKNEAVGLLRLAAGNPLTAGWAFEWLKITEGKGNSKADSNLTQIFTPEPVGQYLAQAALAEDAPL